MKQKLFRYTPGIILLVSVLAFFVLKSPDSPTDRIIRGDGKGYYAYLPALFIHKDLQYNFIEGIEYQYYQGDDPAGKSFTYPQGGKKANKFFPGLAILWFPFFLLGHLFAWLEVFARDGYSPPYQYWIAFSAFYFLWLGVRWLRKLLLVLGSDEGMASLITVAVTLGSNLLYYAAIEPTMPHVYGFAMMAGFLYNLARLYRDQEPGRFRKAVFFLVLAILVRPVNGLAILLVPFMAGDMPAFRAIHTRLAGETLTIIRAVFTVLVLLSVPFILWYLQTGRPVIYSYGPERFRLLHPHMAAILLSFNRGWFLFTPVALVSMIGFADLFRKNRFGFYLMLSFFFLYIYVSSCWWKWDYDSYFGQRAFIDLLPAVAILLLTCYRFLEQELHKRIFTGVLAILTILNLYLFYQHAVRVYPRHEITRSVLKRDFLSLHSRAQVFIPADAVAGRNTLSNDMESDYGPVWMNPGTLTNRDSYHGLMSSRVNQRQQYSTGLESRFDSLFTTTNRAVLVKAWIRAPKEVSEITLVVDFQSQGRSLSYNQYRLDPYITRGQWTPAEVAFYLPENLPPRSTLKVYFYNPSKYYEFYVDDLFIDLLSLKEGPGFRHLNGFNQPHPIAG